MLDVSIERSGVRIPVAWATRRLGFYMAATNFFQNNYWSALPFHITRWRMCVQRNIETRLHYFRCRGRTNIKYSECVSTFLSWLCSMLIACTVLYCHLWPAPLCPIFPHFLIIFFRKKKPNTKCVFWFFQYVFVRNISQSKKNWATYYHKYSGFNM